MISLLSGTVTTAALTFDFEWDILARVLGLAAAAGLHLPALLIVPWALTTFAGLAAPDPDILGGLDSRAPAVLGLLLAAVGLLVRRLAVMRVALALFLAGAGIITAALLPWLLSPNPGAGSTALESLAGFVVAGSVAGVRLGWRFIDAHPPAALPASGYIRQRAWLLPAGAGALVLGAVTFPTASGLAALALLCLALGPGRGALRALGFALGPVARSAVGTRPYRIPAWALADGNAGSPVRPPSGDVRGTPAALLGQGGGGFRPGWLIGGLHGDADLCFRYQTPMGAWELELGDTDAGELEPGPLVQVRSITRGEGRYILLVPPGPAIGPTGRTDGAQRNL